MYILANLLIPRPAARHFFFSLLLTALPPVLVEDHPSSISSSAVSSTTSVFDDVPALALAAVDNSIQQHATFTRRVAACTPDSDCITSDTPVATVTGCGRVRRDSIGPMGGSASSISSAGGIPSTSSTTTTTTATTTTKLITARPKPPRPPRLVRVNVGPTVSYTAPK